MSKDLNLTPDDKKKADKLLAEERRRRAEKQIADARKVIELPEGRRFVDLILEETHVFVSTFAGENTHVSAHEEGKRNIGLLILKLILAAKPSILEQLARERAATKAVNQGASNA